MDEQNIYAMLTDIRGRLSVIEDKVTRLDKTISGNGKPGLCDDVRDLEDKLNTHLRIAEIENSRTEKSSARYWAVWLLIISNAVALAFQLIQGIIK